MTASNFSAFLVNSQNCNETICGAGSISAVQIFIWFNMYFADLNLVLYRAPDIFLHVVIKKSGQSFLAIGM